MSVGELVLRPGVFATATAHVEVLASRQQLWTRPRLLALAGRPRGRALLEPLGLARQVKLITDARLVRVQLGRDG